MEKTSRNPTNRSNDRVRHGANIVFDGEHASVTDSVVQGINGISSSTMRNHGDQTIHFIACSMHNTPLCRVRISADSEVHTRPIYSSCTLLWSALLNREDVRLSEHRLTIGIEFTTCNVGIRNVLLRIVSLTSNELCVTESHRYALWLAHRHSMTPPPTAIFIISLVDLSRLVSCIHSW